MQLIEPSKKTLSHQYERLTDSEVALIEKIRIGDKEAFRQIFEEYYIYLYQLTWQFIKSKEKIEDIIQDIFFSIWSHRASWNPQCNLRLYFNRAARNQVFNHFRNKKKVLDYLPENLSTTIVNEESPFMDFEHQEALNIVQMGIATLPKKCQRIFRLSREFDFSNQDIADILNISLRTVEKQISIALKKLKRYYDIHYKE